MKDLIEVLKNIYNSEINVSIVSFWDGGYDVAIGDEMNGFQWEETYDVTKIDNIAEDLDKHVRLLYPDSDYAKND